MKFCKNCQSKYNLKIIMEIFDLYLDLSKSKVEYATHQDVNDTIIRLESIINNMDRVLKFIKDKINVD